MKKQPVCTVLPSKPSRAQVVIVGGVGAVFLVLAILRLALQGEVAWGPFILSTSLLGVLAALGWAGRILRMDITGTEVVHRGALGRIRSVPLEQVAAVLYAPQVSVSNSSGLGGFNSYLVLLDEHGRCLLRVTSGTIWPDAGLEQAQQALTSGGVEVICRRGMESAGLRRDYPQAVPARHTRPFLVAAIALVLIVAGVALSVALTS